MESGEVQNTVKPCTFFRPRKRVQANRLRKPILDKQQESGDSDSDDEARVEDGTSAVIKKSKVRSNDLLTSRTKKVGDKSLGRVANSSDSSDDGNRNAPSKTAGFLYEGSGQQLATRDELATSSLQTDTADDVDAKSLYDRAKEIRSTVNNPLEQKTYQGMNNYTKFIEKKDRAAGSAHKMSVGPQRASANIRATVRWDYAPDICKDYKETGFCGFGDSCKFMHDRSDYKFGWQLEQEEQEAKRKVQMKRSGRSTYRRRTRAKSDSGDDKNSDADDFVTTKSGDQRYEVSSSDDESDVPFKCILCRNHYTDPIVTKCGHYFCESCALTHYRTVSQRCYACSQPTGGIFNPAKNVISKLQQSEHSVGDQESADDGET